MLKRNFGGGSENNENKQPASAQEKLQSLAPPSLGQAANSGFLPAQSPQIQPTPAQSNMLFSPTPNAVQGPQQPYPPQYPPQGYPQQPYPPQGYPQQPY